jgi:tetratricopeptide (TPR) repeat protein
MAQEPTFKQDTRGDYNASAQSGGTATVTVYNYAGTAAPASAAYRGILGLPPLTTSRTIEQRTPLVEKVYDRLRQSDLNALVLTGIGGVGKSTLAALLYHYFQEPHETTTNAFTVSPLWLSVDRNTTFADIVGTLFEAFGKPVPELGSLSPSNQAAALFALFDTAEASRLVVLDQFENVLNWTTGYALQQKTGIGEWLDALNGQSWSGKSRLLLTSRPSPKGTRAYPPTYLQDYPVEGLSPSEGLQLLRKRGVKAPEVQLLRAVTICNGHALSLTLLIALVQEYDMDLGALLNDPTLWEGDIATNLLDAIFQQLSEVQRAVLQAASIYRIPVPVAALQALVSTSSAAEVQQAVRALLTQHLLQGKGAAHYQPHSIVASYARQHVVEGEVQANRQAVQAYHAQAAQYYLQHAQTSCPLREKRRRVSDVQPFIEAVWHLTQAGQWQEAYKVVEREELFGSLSLWGGNVVLLELCQLLLPNTEWQPEPAQAATISLWLGRVYNSLGKNPEALDYYQQALVIYREVGDRGGEGVTLNNLGLLSDSLGKKQEALDYYQQALSIRREVGDRGGEGVTLFNIGACLVQEQQDVALATFLLAQQRFVEVQSPSQNTVQSWIDYLRGMVGEQQFAAFIAQIEPHAQQIVDQFLQRKQR